MVAPSDRAERIRQYQAAYRAAHREVNREYQRRYRRENAVQLAAHDKMRRSRNRERRREIMRRWVAKNRDGLREYRRQYRQRRNSEDPTFRIRQILTSRIGMAVKQRRGVKAKRTIELLGCDIAFLRNYLEARFTAGMSWDNYGFGLDKWNIDHRIPCAAFDLLDPKQQAACFHYTNLQPMWQRDNRRKWDKIPEPHQAELI